jgi:predicted  nucleic acid-binding Zn-ribbon protein
MDGNTEMHLELKNKISKIERNIKYFEDQVIAADTDVKQILMTKNYHENNGTLDQWQREYHLVESSLKDSNTNLQSEIRMLNILKAKLEKGDYTMSMYNNPIAVKRKHTD